MFLWTSNIPSQRTLIGKKSFYATPPTEQRVYSGRKALSFGGLFAPSPAQEGCGSPPAAYPIGSNGATQAILDARALADALHAQPDPVAALEHYEAARRPATARIVALNRQEGLDAILDMVEERAPEGFARIADVMDPAVLARWVQEYKAAAGHRQVEAKSASST